MSAGTHTCNLIEQRISLRTTLILVLAAAPLAGQGVNIRLNIIGGSATAMAIPDFHAAGAAEAPMAGFNESLWADIEECGLVRLKPKTQYPKTAPQQPVDLDKSQWSGPPVSADYLAIGYGAAQGDLLVVRGWLIDLRQPTVTAGTALVWQSPGAISEAGARKLAHEFAAEIIRKLGGKPIYGTRIYFRSDRSGEDQIWVMDADGSNQQEVTKLKSRIGLSGISPAVSADGSMLAFTTYAEVFPKIYVWALPSSRLPFRVRGVENQFTPSFTPDGKQIVFALAENIYIDDIADLDGRHMRRISASPKLLDMEPKVNPKTGSEIAFVSGRSGHQQLYKMNMDGADVVALTSGKGEAGNPDWHPNGQTLAYAATSGYSSGSWRICLMDVATQKITEIPSGGSRDEHPSWAPDGIHLVFTSKRSGSYQIWTMLADGTHLHQLTFAGSNQTPVWSP